MGFSIEQGANELIIFIRIRIYESKVLLWMWLCSGDKYGANMMEPKERFAADGFLWRWLVEELLYRWCERYKSYWFMNESRKFYWNVFNGLRNMMSVMSWKVSWYAMWVTHEGNFSTVRVFFTSFKQDVEYILYERWL